MDVARHEVRRGGARIELSPREFSLLELLLRHPNQVLTRTQIVEHVWNFDFYSDTNVVDVYIGYLRKKIDSASAAPLIRTVHAFFVSPACVAAHRDTESPCGGVAPYGADAGPDPPLM